MFKTNATIEIQLKPERTQRIVSCCNVRINEKGQINANQLRKALCEFCLDYGLDNIVFRDEEQENEPPVYEILQ